MTRMDGDGGAIEKVARPYSAWGKFFGRKFKDRVTTKGSLTRSPALATVGDRCKMVNNMDEMGSSSAQRSSCPSPPLSREVRACSEVEDLLLLAPWHRGNARRISLSIFFFWVKGGVINKQLFKSTAAALVVLPMLQF